MFADINARVDEFLTDASKGPHGRRVHALVDGALLSLSGDERFARAWRAQPSHSLFPNSTSDTAKAVGPLLIDLTSLSPTARLVLVDHTQELSIASLLISLLDVDELARRLSPFTNVLLPDRTDMIMRFQDPRVLPAWLTILDPACGAYLGSCCNTWTFVDPSWRLQTIDFASQLAPQAPTFPLTLSDAAQAKLERDCFPHTVISRFRREDRSTLERIPLHARYDFFSDQIARAKAHGLESFPDIEVYCSLAIEFGPAFDERPAFDDILGEFARGGGLAHAAARCGTAGLSMYAS